MCLRLNKKHMDNQLIFVRIATINDIKYVNEIINETAASALARGTGIAKRTPESVAQKMREGKSVIALTSTGRWVGFSYFETWEEGKFVSNSGMIVAPEFRKSGVAKSIKDRIFKVSRRMYPDAKVFSITSGTAVMKMNAQLGFLPVAFSEITKDESFWEGCRSCPNYDILERKHKCNCLCTAMLFDPLISVNHSILPIKDTAQRYANGHL
jgi:N-acetylglutamate synthase-like GNAT family acetyltransferase